MIVLLSKTFWWLQKSQGHIHSCFCFLTFDPSLKYCRFLDRVAKHIIVQIKNTEKQKQDCGEMLVFMCYNRQLQLNVNKRSFDKFSDIFVTLCGLQILMFCATTVACSVINWHTYRCNKRCFLKLGHCENRFISPLRYYIKNIC